MTWTRRLGTTGLATLLGISLGLVVTASPAHAAPPVAANDATSMYAGNAREVDVLANDTDADSPNDLAVCRLGNESYKRVFAESIGDGVIFAYSLPGAKPGTYTFTYYACDFQSLVPATLTVTIDPEPEVTAKALPGRPGKIKVTNPADFKIRYLYGSFKEPNPDGTIKIARNSSVILTVRRPRSTGSPTPAPATSSSRARSRTSPAAGHHTARGGRPVSPRLAKLWASGV